MERLGLGLEVQVQGLGWDMALGSHLMRCMVSKVSSS